MNFLEHSLTLFDFYCDKKILILGLRSYQIKQNFLVDQIQTWPKEWFVKFKLVVTAFNSPYEWPIILHFTTGGNKGTFGNRIPALWFKNPEKEIGFLYRL